MQPRGRKILVKDITEKEVKTKAGIILDPSKSNPYKKVKVVDVSPDCEYGLKKGDVCLSLAGGVEVETGLWLCNEDLLHLKL
jgi:co-chaperonin GroES (HSP10)